MVQWSYAAGDSVFMNMELSKQEAWKLLDAIKAYTKDYSVSGAVSKTFNNIIKKLEKIVND